MKILHIMWLLIALMLIASAVHTYAAARYRRKMKALEGMIVLRLADMENVDLSALDITHLDLSHCNQIQTLRVDRGDVTYTGGTRVGVVACEQPPS